LGYLDSVGIQPDGTLWVSGKSDQFNWTADKLTRFGDETNWQQVAGAYRPTSVLLLKKDGTLWLWGTNRFDWQDWPQKWPGLRAFTPYQIGTNSDWREMDIDLVRNAAGNVWRVWRNNTNGNDELIRETNYDAVPLENNSMAVGGGFGAYIRKDGTPWVFYNHYVHVTGQGDQVNFETVQCSRETNWISTAAAWGWVVALKSDGTLWQWNWQHHSYAVDFTAPPTQLGIHYDWVAVASIDNGVVTLAADGSLWFWPNRVLNSYDHSYAIYGRTLLKLPKQPQFLGNIFGKAD
jgi:alpha-tubulin suppressor-like RCC1 family protein